MNKDEEIIKLAQFLHNRYCNEDACCKDINECKICNCTSKALAEVLYKEGYRKVPDCVVILTPEERDEELKACNEKQAELENEIYALKTNYACLSEHCTDLENKNVAAENMIDSQAKEIERLKELNKVLENDNYNKELNLESLCDEIDRLESVIKEKDRLCFDCKKSVKEFAEKLKAKAHNVVGFNVCKKVYAKEYTINEIDIDELIKEFLK